MFDLLLKNGLIVDGTGMPGYRGDVAINDGKLAVVGGQLGMNGRQIIDVGGQVIAPGFIDPHTHFDAQLLWDGAARPALAHGVTTVVPGNCSLSLAPLKVKHRSALVGMFRQIEELPASAFTEGFEWTWESFDGYLDAIRRQLAINVAPLVGHSVIRLWVMDQDASSRAATADEIKQMQQLLRQCLEAGAVGLSTSYVDMDENFRPVPSRWAHGEELEALAAVLGEYGKMLQVVPEFYATDVTLARVDQLANYSLRYGIPTTFSPLFDSTQQPDNVARTMARVEEQFARGARVWPQVQTRPIDISFSFASPSLFFGRLPGWFRLMRLPRDQRLAELSDAGTRDKLVAEAGADGGAAMMGFLRVRGGMGDPGNLAGMRLSDIAKDRGVTCAEALIDASVERDLNLYFIAENMGHHVADRVGPMLSHPLVHVGASDGGAHIMSFSTYGDTGFLFSRYVRESKHLNLAQAVKKITSDTAAIWGMKGRGLLQSGCAADVVVFDADRIDRGSEYAVWDVPGRGMRYVRDSQGIDTVVVNGQVAYRQNGGYTQQKAGRIV